MREIFDVFVSASSFTSSSAIRIPVTAGDLEESVSEEFETRLSWEEMAGAEECIQRVCVCVCVCVWERERELRQRREGVLERQEEIGFTCITVLR